MRKNIPLTSEQRNEIIARFTSGETTGEIAIDFGCHATTIQSKLKNWGIYLGQQRIFTEDEKTEIIRRFGLGETTPIIGKALNSSSSVILRNLQAWGIDTS